MIVKVHNTVNFTQVANSAARDPRLSLDTRGLLVMMLSYPTSFQLSVDWVIKEANKGQQADDPIGEKRLRRMTTELKSAGYLQIRSNRESDGSWSGKEWHVYGQNLAVGEIVTSSSDQVPDLAVTPCPPTKSRLDKFPAAKTFMDAMSVALDPGTIEHIQSEVKGGDLKLWHRICSDHMAGMTPEQKLSEAYRTKALKFCLRDYRKELERDQEHKIRSQYVADKADDKYKQPRKSFTEYVTAAEYEYGSDAYIKFKESWLERAEETGNAEAIREVTEHEGLRATLAKFEARKGSVEK